MAYSREVADAILAKMSEGMTVKEICREAGMPPPSTFRMWLIDDVDGIAARYARARECQMAHWADEVLEASDDGTNDWVMRENKRGELERVVDREHIQRSALRVDARKWLLAKLHPEYMDKIRAEHTGANGGPIQTQVVEDARPALGEFLAEFATKAEETRH